jgi:hypothetical protein
VFDSAVTEVDDDAALRERADVGHD